MLQIVPQTEKERDKGKLKEREMAGCRKEDKKQKRAPK